MLVDFQGTAQHYIPDDRTHYNHYRKNFKPYTVYEINNAMKQQSVGRIYDA
jgi:hypothetical protein